MRGGAQAHLMRCSDGNFYVVKFRNNPQHLRVLANELLATRLAQGAELPVAAAEVVEVGDLADRAHSRVEHPTCRKHYPVSAGTTIRVAVRSKSARRTGVRLFADGDVGPGTKRGDFCRDVGHRQVDRK